MRKIIETIRFIRHSLKLRKEHFFDSVIPAEQQALALFNYQSSAEPVNGDTVFIITLNGLVMRTVYSAERHRSLYQWGNCFTTEEVASLKSLRVSQYLKSRIDLGAAVRLAYRELKYINETNDMPDTLKKKLDKICQLLDV